MITRTVTLPSKCRSQLQIDFIPTRRTRELADAANAGLVTTNCEGLN